MQYYDSLRLGQMKALADQCADASGAITIYQRLAAKTDKSAQTRANARQMVDYWSNIQKACQAPPVTPPPVLTPVVPVQTGGGSPVVNPAAPLTLPPFIPLIMPVNPLPPQIYGPASPADGRFIASSVSAAQAAAAGAIEPAGEGPQINECDIQSPMTYDDEYGPMQVLRVICA